MQMKRNVTFLLLVVSSLCAIAQNDGKSVALDEVVVKAAKVVNKIDGQTIYPTDIQKESSSNGYGILQKLALPNIKIDLAAHSVSATDNRGEVQLRINGIIVERQEMIALDPKAIARINFVNNPGVRYGDGIAYVIDIITRRAAHGYTAGTDINAAITSLSGNGTAYGKWNTGKSELSVSYDFSGNRLRGLQTNENANYTLNDGSVYTVTRNDIATQCKQLSHNAKLTYLSYLK